jgi:hypothetical protein
MNASLYDRLAVMGVNSVFVRNCIDSGKLTQQQVEDRIAEITRNATGHDVALASIQAYNREIWRLRNLRKRSFDAECFDRDVVGGLGFDCEDVARSVSTGKMTLSEVEQMVVAVCRGNITIDEASSQLAGVAAEVDEVELIELGFDVGILDRCVRARTTTWNAIDRLAGKVREGELSVEDVEEELVTAACDRLTRTHRFPRACKLRNLLDRKNAGLRVAA